MKRFKGILCMATVFTMLTGTLAAAEVIDATKINDLDGVEVEITEAVEVTNVEVTNVEVTDAEVTDIEVTDAEVIDAEVISEVITKGAISTTATVMLGEENLEFEAYNIDGNNYFKLRDLAYVLSGTEKQFEVEWNGEENAIALTSGKEYTAVGGEMEVRDLGNPLATTTSSKIFKDGEELVLTAYNIKDNNFFKLRDIAEAFDIGITWDGETQTIVIIPEESYVAE